MGGDDGGIIRERSTAAAGLEGHQGCGTLEEAKEEEEAERARQCWLPLLGCGPP